MGKFEKIITKMRTSPQNVRYSELYKVCVKHFGEPRQSGTSHAVFKTPWQGLPRINIQEDKGMAKRYQVLQVVEAIDKLVNEEW